jgi:mRNA interferase RelE/StbE
VKYKVDFTPQALEDISKLDRAVVERIEKKIEWLSESLDAISPQALKGKFHGTFKLVIGDWRVIYTPDFDNKAVTIHLIGHRRDIYKI